MHRNHVSSDKPHLTDDFLVTEDRIRPFLFHIIVGQNSDKGLCGNEVNKKMCFGLERWNRIQITKEVRFCPECDRIYRYHYSRFNYEIPEEEPT